MDILAVAPYLPFEGVPHAGGEYLLRHLQALARTNRVTLIVPGSPEVLEQSRRAPAWLDVVLGPMDLDARSFSRTIRDATYRRLMASPPGPSAESLRAVLEAGLVERARRADVIELHWAEYARFATVLRRAGVHKPISVFEYDVDLFLMAQRVRRYRRGYRKVLGVATSPLSRRIEQRGLRDADLILVLKSADALLLERAGVQTPARVIDPWLDAPAGSPPQRVPRSVVFAGALWRDENAEGATWFLEHVWPAVRAAISDATLTLAGSDPTPRLREIAAAADGVRVTGEVPDLLPYYQEASVFVAPILVGGGLKFKIPQAMLCGTPIVATNCAAEGVAEIAPAGTFLAITDDAAAMAQHVIDALSDPVRSAAVGAAAQTWCREHYSFDRSMRRLLTEYATLCSAHDDLN